MQFKESDRLGTRLFAIKLRLAELDREMRQTQIRVCHLESQLEDANLAKLMGEDAGNPAEIHPELESSRGRLENQRETVARVKKSQRKANAEFFQVRVEEIRRERERKGAE